MSFMLNIRFRMLFQTLFCGLLFVSISLQAQLSTSAYQRLFTIHGSNTLGEELLPNLVAAFLQDRGAVQVRIENSTIENERVVRGYFTATGQSVEVLIAAHGSGTGYRYLANGIGDIAASSRPINASEFELLQPFGDFRSAGHEHVIGIDGLSIIVHPSNPLRALTVEQVAQIFSGEIDDWSQLGLPQGRITRYARDNKSGTWDSFNSMVLNGRYQLASDALRFESTAQLSDQVSRDRNAIGFVGLSSVRSAKAIAIADGDVRALLANDFSVATEDYALSRRLYLYTKVIPEGSLLDAFLAFALHDDGQSVVAQSGFVSQQLHKAIPDYYAQLPEYFQQVTEEAQRLSLNFRFREGSAQLDNKAMQDVERLAEFMQQNPQYQLLLVGFGDQGRDAERSQLLSRLRAMTVRRELVRLGVYPRQSVGFGEDLPVASDEHLAGRHKNRRVEVWLKPNPRVMERVYTSLD